ncbi:MAG: PQQ-binding-like beta-propeller repeat protein [Novipirellula sp. JB048]
MSGIADVGGLVYMVSDDGIVTCRELADGNLLWQKRVRGAYAASPLYARGRIYLFSSEGNIFTLKAGRRFEILAENELGDGFMASPAVVGDQLILRSKSALYSITK